MARGGSKRRTYVRDANGRFASTPGGGSKSLAAARKAARSTGGAKGTLAARTSLKASRAKLRAKDPADPTIRNALSTRAQKGAVTRGNQSLRAAKVVSQRTAVGRSGVGTISKKRTPVMKATVLGGDKSITIKSASAKRSTVVPALQGSASLEPLSPQRKKVAARAMARGSSLNELAIKAGEELKKAQSKAIPANNPYSDITPKARKAALTRLKKAEEVAAKIRKSQMTAQRAKSFAEGMAGATKQGYTRYDNAVRRSDIRASKSKPPTPKPPSRVKGSRTRLPGMGGVVAKPKGLKPAALKRQTKLTPTRITGRPKEQQDKRNLIARALREMPKEKRAKFIKARKEIEAEQSQKTVRESARIVNSSQSQPSIQKQRWAKKAEIYANAAMKNKEKAASLESAAGRFSRDWNFISQPGNFSARKKVNSQQDKAFELRRKARQQELRAEELRRLATTNKGDAERKRQSQRDKVSVEKGSRISTLVYGPGKVVRVNKKTVSYLIDRTGSVINVDKSWVINS